MTFDPGPYTLSMEIIDNIFKMPEGKLVKAAVRVGDKLYLGWRHADIMRELKEHNIVEHVFAEDQGFVTENGRFLMRPQAKSWAFYVEQIEDTEGPILTSEDLWDNEGNPRG